MRCSIVIRAFNEEQHLGRLLEGIKQQTFKDVEIVLVDSGSTDATVSIAQSHGAKIVHIQPQDFTFGRSLNLGIQSASGEIVVIVSAHVYPVYPDWLERLLEPFSDVQVALSYGKQRGPKTAQYSEHQIFHQWFSETSQPRQPHAFCNNANAAIRRMLWEQFPYDETLTGLEDLDWARRVMQNGHALAYVAEAEIIHIHNETPQGVLNRYRREAMAFKRVYPEAHFSLYDFFRMVISNILFDLVHAGREKALWQNITSIFWFRWMQFWGTYKGYRETSPLTPELRQTFYYPVGWQKSKSGQRDVEPIRYNE